MISYGNFEPYFFGAPNFHLSLAYLFGLNQQSIPCHSYFPPTPRRALLDATTTTLAPTPGHAPLLFHMRRPTRDRKTTARCSLSGIYSPSTHSLPPRPQLITESRDEAEAERPTQWRKVYNSKLKIEHAVGVFSFLSFFGFSVKKEYSSVFQPVESGLSCALWRRA